MTSPPDPIRCLCWRSRHPNFNTARDGTGSRPFIGLPDSVGGWAAALLYVNYWQTSPQLLPTAWAVTNEIVFYVLIGLGLSKTPGRTLLWFLVSLVYSVLAADYAPKNADLNYFLPSAASLPFALGALAYHARGLIDRRWAPVFAAYRPW